MEENMRKSQFTETQIVAVFKQHEQGFKAADLARLNAAKIHFKFSIKVLNQLLIAS